MFDERLKELEAKFSTLHNEFAELKKSRTQRAIRLMRMKKRAIIAALACFIGIPLLHAAVPNSFTAGNAAVAADVNANFTYLDEVSVPVGGIIGWHRNITVAPLTLPASGKWVECNGQVLSDGSSPLNGRTIPNLNGESGGADSPGQAAKIAMFLRGGITSGTGQTDAFQGHEHYLSDDGGGLFIGRAGGSVSGDFIANPSFDGSGNKRRFQTGGGYFADVTNGTPRPANETRPKNMSVVWIMRVK